MNKILRHEITVSFKIKEKMNNLQFKLYINIKIQITYNCRNILIEWHIMSFQVCRVFYTSILHAKKFRKKLLVYYQISIFNLYN